MANGVGASESLLQGVGQELCYTGWRTLIVSIGAIGMDSA